MRKSLPGFDAAGAGLAVDDPLSNLFKRPSREITSFCKSSTTPRMFEFSFSNEEILSKSSPPVPVKDEAPSTRSSEVLMCCLALAISETRFEEEVTPFYDKENNIC